MNTSSKKYVKMKTKTSFENYVTCKKFDNKDPRTEPNEIKKKLSENVNLQKFLGQASNIMPLRKVPSITNEDGSKISLTQTLEESICNPKKNDNLMSLKKCLSTQQSGKKIKNIFSFTNFEKSYKTESELNDSLTKKGSIDKNFLNVLIENRTPLKKIKKQEKIDQLRNGIRSLKRGENYCTFFPTIMNNSENFSVKSPKNNGINYFDSLEKINSRDSSMEIDSCSNINEGPICLSENLETKREFVFCDFSKNENKGKIKTSGKLQIKENSCKNKILDKNEIKSKPLNQRKEIPKLALKIKEGMNGIDSDEFFSDEKKRLASQSQLNSQDIFGDIYNTIFPFYIFTPVPIEPSNEITKIQTPKQNEKLQCSIENVRFKTNREINLLETILNELNSSDEVFQVINKPMLAKKISKTNALDIITFELENMTKKELMDYFDFYPNYLLLLKSAQLSNEEIKKYFELFSEILYRVLKFEFLKNLYKLEKRKDLLVEWILKLFILNLKVPEPLIQLLDKKTKMDVIFIFFSRLFESNNKAEAILKLIEKNIHLIDSVSKKKSPNEVKKFSENKNLNKKYLVLKILVDFIQNFKKMKNTENNKICVSFFEKKINLEWIVKNLELQNYCLSSLLNQIKFDDLQEVFLFTTQFSFLKKNQKNFFSYTIPRKYRTKKEIEFFFKVSKIEDLQSDKDLEKYVKNPKNLIIKKANLNDLAQVNYFKVKKKAQLYRFLKILLMDIIQECIDNDSFMLEKHKLNKLSKKIKKKKYKSFYNISFDELKDENKKRIKYKNCLIPSMKKLGIKLNLKNKLEFILNKVAVSSNFFSLFKCTNFSKTYEKKLFGEPFVRNVVNSIIGSNFKKQKWFSLMDFSLSKTNSKQKYPWSIFEMMSLISIYQQSPEMLDLDWLRKVNQ